MRNCGSEYHSKRKTNKVACSCYWIFAFSSRRWKSLEYWKILTRGIYNLILVIAFSFQIQQGCLPRKNESCRRLEFEGKKKYPIKSCWRNCRYHFRKLEASWLLNYVLFRSKIIIITLKKILQNLKCGVKLKLRTTKLTDWRTRRWDWHLKVIFCNCMHCCQISRLTCN